jgi:hypothetical protein
LDIPLRLQLFARSLVEALNIWPWNKKYGMERISTEEGNEIFCKCGHAKLLHEKNGCSYSETKNYHEKDGYTLRISKIDEYCICKEYGKRKI